MSENIYLVLELFLDPALTDAALLEQDISRRIGDWNKKIVANPKFKAMVEKAHLFKQLGLATLDLKSAAQQAIVIQTKKLHDAIKIVDEDGVITELEFRELVQRFPCFKESTIRKYLPRQVSADAGAARAPTAPPVPAGVKEIPPHEMEEMALRLADVENGRYHTLYELLGLTPASTTETLLKTARAAAEKNRRAAKKTAEVDAKSFLLGKALVCFKEESARKAYDMALRRRPFDELCATRFDLRALDKSVTPDAYRLSIKETREKGFTQQEAEWLVYDFYCNRKKCQLPKLETRIDPSVQCPACYHLNAPTVKVCKDCGTPLQLTCPTCRRENLSTVKYCSCGFAIGDMANAIFILQAAKKELALDKIDEAKAFIRQTFIYWPDYPDAKTLRGEIDKREREVIAIQGRVVEIEKKIRELREQHQLFKAENLIAELKKISPAAVTQNSHVKYVVETLGKIRDALSRISTLSDNESRIDLCEDILAKAADCVEAGMIRQEALRHVPLSPPFALSVKELPGAFQLNWQPPDDKRPVRFLVVRKKNGVPASPGDGEKLIGELSHHEYTDSTVEVGAVYGYAVFSQRNERTESSGCRSRFVQMFGEAENIKVTPGDRCVSLSWNSLAHADRMIVTRYEGNPPVINDRPLTILDKSSLHDSDLENGTTYTYRIQVVFKTPEGKDHVTDGKTISCQPLIPPAPVIDLRFTTQPDAKVRFDWTPPDDCVVYVFTPKFVPDKEHEFPKSGTSVFTTPDELVRRFGEVLPVTTPGKYIWELTESGIRVILPVSFRDGLAVFGRSLLHARLPEISSFHIQSTGIRLHLSWEWPEGIEKVLLLYRHDRTPTGPDDARATRCLIDRADYMKNQSVDFAGGRDYYFSIHTVFERKGKPVYSKGFRAQTARTLIRYKLVFSQSDGGGEVQAGLIIQAANDDAHLPAFLLKKEQGQRPLHRDRGQIITEIPAVNASRRSVVIPSKFFEKDCYIRLFVKDPDESPFYMIYDPPQNQLELHPRQERETSSE